MDSKPKRRILNMQRAAWGIMLLIPFGMSLFHQVGFMGDLLGAGIGLDTLPFLIVLFFFLGAILLSRPATHSGQTLITAAALLAWITLDLMGAVSDQALGWFLPIGLIALVLLIAALWTGSGSWKRQAGIALVIALAVALRVTLVHIIDTDLQSDILDTHLFALDVLNGDLQHTGDYSYIPWALHLDMTGFVFAGVYRLFGASVDTLKYFMIALSALSTWLVYRAGRDVSADHRIGMAAAICFAISPVLVVYTGVPTDEHLAMPLIIGILSLRIRSPGSRLSARWGDLLQYGLIGIMTGMIEWFRPVGLVMLAALIVSDLLYRDRRMRMRRWLLGAALVIAAYMLTTGAARSMMEWVFQEDLPSTAATACGYVLIGFNPDSPGIHDVGDARLIYAAVDEFPDDGLLACKALLRTAASRVTMADLPGIFMIKQARVWASDGQMFELAAYGSRSGHLLSILRNLNVGFYFVLSLLAFIGIVFSFRRRPSREVFMMQLFITGLAFVLLIAEAQNRYRVILYPYLIILAMLAIKQILEAVRGKGTDPQDE